MNAPDTVHPYLRQFPQLGTDPVGIEAVTSPAYFELEREHIFKKMWLNVCREQEIPAPNDYLVKAVKAAGKALGVALAFGHLVAAVPAHVVKGPHHAVFTARHDDRRTQDGDVLDQVVVGPGDFLFPAHVQPHYTR